MLKKRALFSIPISIILIGVIVTSFFLLNIKPDTSHIKKSQKLAEYSKPAVVRIVHEVSVEWQFLENYPDLDAFMKELDYKTGYWSQGSGAIISSNGYVVTNAHVVLDDKMTDDEIYVAAFDQLVSYVADYFFMDYEVAYLLMYSIAYPKEITNKTTVILPGGDQLDGEVKVMGAPIYEKDGKDVAVLKVEGKNLPTLKLGDSDEIEDQDDIWAIGYPAAVDVDIFSDDSTLESSMNAGQVSATSKKLETGASVVQINAAISPGNSGGPVINEKGEIIGLATASSVLDGQQIQGFNFAIPVNIVKEFVNQAGAKNESGNTDKLYKEGLELYWGGYYKDALKKFESVQRIFPNHSEIKGYISKAEKKSGESKILWSNYETIFYIVDSVAGLLIIMLILFTFVFKPKQVPAPANEE